MTINISQKKLKLNPIFRLTSPIMKNHFNSKTCFLERTSTKTVWTISASISWTHAIRLTLTTRQVTITRTVWQKSTSLAKASILKVWIIVIPSARMCIKNQTQTKTVSIIRKMIPNSAHTSTRVVKQSNRWKFSLATTIFMTVRGMRRISVSSSNVLVSQRSSLTNGSGTAKRKKLTP